MLDKLQFRRIRRHLIGCRFKCEDSPVCVKVRHFLSRKQVCVFQFGFDDFRNLGDQALWLSLDILLQSLPKKLRPKGLLFESSWPPNEKDKPVVLIFPGGGSLGTRYHSSRRRVELLEKMRPEGIIQMPISTSFSNTEAISLHRLCNAYAAPLHKMVFTRDEQSEKEAKSQILISTQLVPDLTSILPNMSHLRTGGGGTVYLIRRDQESRNEALPPEAFGRVFDWDDEALSFPSLRISLSRKIFRATRSARLPDLARQSRMLAKIQLRLARAISLHETTRALCFLSQFDKVVTDRLHAALLAEKLGISVFAADNDSGKLSRYIQTWTRPLGSGGFVSIFPSVKDASRAAK